MNRIVAKLRKHILAVLIVLVLAALGVTLSLSTSAASFVISLEAEAGSPGSSTVTLNSPAASGGSFVRFGGGSSGASTTPNFKIAVVGDSDISTNAKAVLNVIKNEGAQMVLHVGDFDYIDNPSSWNTQTTSVLGQNFPMMATIGNHDTTRIPDYQTEINKRSAGMACTGNRALRAICKMNGLVVVEEGIGAVYGRDNATEVSFVRDAMAANSSSLWKICAWHEQMRAMQVGPKTDSTGWLVWEECRKAGAIVFTGHDHNYQRTKTLTSFTEQTVDPTCNTVAVACVGPNRSFHILSGAGGYEIRSQERCLPTTPPYGCKGEWAKLYTLSQGGKYGATFVTFNVDGNPKLARGYFKDISGTVVDQFEIRRD